MARVSKPPGTRGVAIKRVEIKKPNCREAAGLVRIPGTDLLSHHVGSTIGAAGLNYSVRNGKRCGPRAMRHQKTCASKCLTYDSVYCSKHTESPVRGCSV